MGKKSRNKTTTNVTPRIGEPLHIKHLGKNMYVVATVLDTETVHNVWLQNSEEGTFTALETPLTITPVKTVPAGEAGKSLGLLVFTTPELVNNDNNLVEGEFLPFLTGESVGWRNPKIGHLLQEEDDVLEALKNSASFYKESFPGYDNVYRIEEVVDPMGWSSTLVSRIDSQIKNIVS